MPNKSGRLLKSEKDDFINKLNEIWPRPQECEICGKDVWEIGSYLTTPLPVSKSDDVIIGGNIHPLLQVICMNCGNTKFFNALVLGVKLVREALLEKPVEGDANGD